MIKKSNNKTFRNVQKRGGLIIPFDISKITNAIFRAAEKVGKLDFDLAQSLAEEVILRLSKKKRVYKKYVPTIEEIQDTVEHVLLDADENKIAKEYILYRQKRADIRKEKAAVLDKEEVDEVDKKFDLNALRVLASRYLRKEDSGRIIESPKELFIRVATHTSLSSLFYDKQIYQKRKSKTIFDYEDFSPEKNKGKYKIGKYILNQFHLEAIKRVYDRFNKNGNIKLSWGDFLGKMKDGYFDKYEKEIDSFYELMTSRKFLPNTPALANFGNVFGMGSACFVLDIEDNIHSIMDTLKSAAIIFKSGGGVGYNFSRLRPAGDFVKSTGGASSGPITFMSLYDRMTDVIKQGGIRRGANMGMLNSNHPDIEDFIKCKTGNSAMRNFNISIMILPEFWQCLEEKKPYPLINPRNNKVVKYIDPKSLFDLISYQAWESAEPGVLFFDTINKYNPLVKALGPISCTNPCGEVLLYPFESCNLGSINLLRFVKRVNGGGEASFDWDEFERVVKLATAFLDNVIDINKYPLPEIEEMTLKTRKIGLGVMGLADAMYDLGISYDSEKGREFMENIIEALNYFSKEESVAVSIKRGRFPLYEKSFYGEGKLPFAGYKDKSAKKDWKELIRKIKKGGLRNSFTTVIAPTGSISMIAGCSSGIEPNYSLVYEKNVAVGSFYYVNPVFENIVSRAGIFSDRLLKRVIDNNSSVKGLRGISKKLQNVLKTAMDISPEDHIKTLSVIQKWVDSSISKTNNLPSQARPDDIEKIYLLAHKLGCKGATIFRDKSIKDQVLVAGGNNSKDKESEGEDKFISKKDSKAEGYAVYYQPNVKEISSSQMDFSNIETSKQFCINCHTELAFQEGCRFCPICGWSKCG